MRMLIFMRTMGGHYPFKKVPFARFNDLFGFKRNMYDRVPHFSVGFYAYALLEYTNQHQLIRSHPSSYLFPLCVIGTVAMSHELIEWVYAELAGGDADAAFLSSQADIWDAQKGMFADTSGAIPALVVYAFCAPEQPPLTPKENACQRKRLPQQEQPFSLACVFSLPFIPLPADAIQDVLAAAG
ncbi:DUF2238 domain-containing protein [Hymenobacter sp. HSC-4F20]|nr:DUF2238 domain-containing protein [Hymenobacter sp. HSC-4F20]